MSTITGVLQRLPRSGGFLRSVENAFQPDSADVWIAPQYIHEYKLVDGALVTAQTEPGEKRNQVINVESVCGVEPNAFRDRSRFDRLAAINPDERFSLEKSGNPSMRIVELLAPIGKGTRGLIVAPPKTGKTQLLEDLAHAIHTDNPDTRIVVLLIDERPEEVTHFRRRVPAEVLASSSDQSIDSHVRLAELTLQHIRCELECGRDIVVLVDSITRMVRAFNQHGKGTRRTLSGGLDAGAIQIPRQFFGLARNVENGGSVTVLATALIETGSRMDEAIFEEFKGTGNSEVVLDRTLADNRIFPAINVQASGTRKEELLFSSEEYGGIIKLRRMLAGLEKQDAINTMLKLIESEPDNLALLQRLALE